MTLTIGRPKAEVTSRTDTSITYKTDRGETTVTGSPETLLSTVIYQDGSREKIDINMSTVVASVDFSAKRTDPDPHITDVDYSKEIEPEAEDRLPISAEEALETGQTQMTGFTRDPNDWDVLDAYLGK